MNTSHEHQSRGRRFKNMYLEACFLDGPTRIPGFCFLIVVSPTSPIYLIIWLQKPTMKLSCRPSHHRLTGRCRRGSIHVLPKSLIWTGRPLMSHCKQLGLANSKPLFVFPFLGEIWATPLPFDISIAALCMHLGSYFRNRCFTAEI